jgi:hypothetical protein
VSFKPYSELVGADWVVGDYPVVRKLYWLGEKVGAKGKTSLEISREQMKETYAYEGDYSDADLTAKLTGKEVELSCKENEKGYTEVEYANAPGGKKGGFKRKEVPADKRARLTALLSGNTPVEATVDPGELFKSMTQGAA